MTPDMRNAVAILGLALLAACSEPPGAAPGPRFVAVEAGALTADRHNTGGVSWADVNGDGYPDAVITNGYNVAAGEPYVGQENRIYLGDGTGGFAPASDTGFTDALEFSSGSAWADVDGDGHVDVVVASQRDMDNVLYLGHRDEAGRVTYVRVEGGDLTSDGGWTYAVGLVDVDGDGLLDVFVSEGGLSHEGPNRLYRNLGGGHFAWAQGSALSALSQGTGAAVWADYDNDGDPDLFTASRTTGDGVPQALYRNEGDFIFARMEDVGLAQDFRPLITAAWADIDNDLDLDLFVGGMSGFFGSLYINNGDGTFSLREDDPPSTAAGNAYGTTFGDFDNDGDQDLIVAHWGAGTALYLNDGAGHFDYASVAAMPPHVEWAGALAYADYDSDGDLDVLIGNWPYGDGASQENTLLRNDLAPSQWVRFRLVGTAPNTSAVGARVYLRAGGAVQMRELHTQTSWRSQNDLGAHFGLGDADAVDEVIVRWPDGAWERWGAPDVNRELVLRQGEGEPGASPTLNF